MKTIISLILHSVVIISRFYQTNIAHHFHDETKQQRIDLKSTSCSLVVLVQK